MAALAVTKAARGLADQGVLERATEERASQRIDLELRFGGYDLALASRNYLQLQCADPRVAVRRRGIVRAARRLLDFPESGRPG